jgi:hypothetical protein
MMPSIASRHPNPSKISLAVIDASIHYPGLTPGVFFILTFYFSLFSQYVAEENGGASLDGPLRYSPLMASYLKKKFGKVHVEFELFNLFPCFLMHVKK